MKKFTLPLMAATLALFLHFTPAIAQTNLPATALSDAKAETMQADEIDNAQSIRKLQAIKQALEEKRERVRDLVAQIQDADEADKARLGEQIAELRGAVAELTKSFETIAVSGANLRSLTEAQDQNLAWRDELIQIARPLLSSIKEATEKPRRIAELRSAIQLYQQQLEVTRKATESIDLFKQQQMPPTVADELEVVAASWHERSRDIERSLKISHDELRELEVDKVDIFKTMSRAAREFILGRGLTLLLALITGIGVWFAMRTLRRLVKFRRRPPQNSERAANIRLLLYSYHLITMALVSLAVLSVFYARDDLLLLSLSIIALAMLALGAWRFLPRYIQQARLLLNVGSVREGERVIYNGLPFRIASLNLHSELRNPELEGSIRLPLAALAQLTSRSYGDEAWFPCHSGDYLLLADGVFAQVVQQTVELVRLKVVGSTVQFASADFLQLNVRNLSRDGFAVAVVFGIDYQHQPISLDIVPQRFSTALQSAFERSDFADHLIDLLVEFKQAGSSSLDYLIYATMDSRSAASYFKIARLIQQTCVDICNNEGWIIPFNQVTIHQAEARPADQLPARITQSAPST